MVEKLFKKIIDCSYADFDSNFKVHLSLSL